MLKKLSDICYVNEENNLAIVQISTDETEWCVINRNASMRKTGTFEQCEKFVSKAKLTSEVITISK